MGGLFVVALLPHACGPLVASAADASRPPALPSSPIALNTTLTGIPLPPPVRRYASVFPEVPPLLVPLLSAAAIEGARRGASAPVLSRDEMVEVLLEAARQVP